MNTHRMYPATCATCGIEFMASSDRFKRAVLLYCSRECNHSNWFKPKEQIAATRSERIRTYRLRNPDKTRAHRDVENARLSGKLVPQPCEHCGEKNKIHAHHEDYSKTLEVTWLCRPCHQKLHNARRL